MAILKIALVFATIVTHSIAYPIARGESLVDPTGLPNSINHFHSQIGSFSNRVDFSGSTGLLDEKGSSNLNNINRVNIEKDASEIAHKRAEKESKTEYSPFNIDNEDTGKSYAASAAMHLAKANAAEKVKEKAAAEEKNEEKAAKEDEDISEKIKKASAAKFATAEKEADELDKLVVKLNKEAAEHEAKAREAKAKALALATDTEGLNEVNDLVSKLNPVRIQNVMNLKTGDEKFQSLKGVEILGAVNPTI